MPPTIPNNPLYPAYTQIEYHSAYGFHNMLIPNTAPDDVTGAPLDLTLQAWDTSSRNWSDMVLDLITEIVPRFPAEAEFDRATLWTLDTPTSLPFYRGSFAIGAIGTAAVPGWSMATQETISMRDANGKLLKLVLLDFATGDDFGRYTNATTIGVNLIVGQLSLSSNAWSSRQNGQPSTFLARTATLNEKLRREYRLA